MSDYALLAELLFPHIDKTPEDYEAVYPPRNLPEGAKVTRFAPSPTGFMHLGNLFVSMIDSIAARDGGVFYLRIEDTDKKREVEDAVERILHGLAAFGIVPQEGEQADGGALGDYGPYRQSQRKDIYQCYAKSLVEKGLAYPCFCTEEELNYLRAKQETAGANPGYYGEWAVFRNAPLGEVRRRLRAGEPYVLRLRSDGSEEKKIVVEDLVKGKIEMPENIMDLVLLKADGIPTYHFAHAVDDHLMRTTHVVRGDEWIASLPVHIALFCALGFKAPKYVHVSPIMKTDGGGKRKLSKRKDPEAAVSYYAEQGYPKEGVVTYLLTLANSNFEDWLRANPGKAVTGFPFNFKKMSPSGALFDLAKLNDICKNVISVMTAEQVYDYVMDWAAQFDKTLHDLFSADPCYAKAILSIDRGVKKPRKDIATWSQVLDYVSYFYDEAFRQRFDLPENISAAGAKAILSAYAAVYDENDDKDAWFERIKALCEPLGLTPNVKEFKANPQNYKGHVGDVSTVIRLALTGRENTPDLYSIMRLLGKDRVLRRLNTAL
ncbi:MAG: glutamate--tRNA ligase [Oscillospiraceae bacterium]|nr:glutamate--tRNA ligase [Oscillospiraceae bacterium]